MSSQFYANMGYLLPLNKETLEKFDTIEESVLMGLINLIEEDGFDPDSAEWSFFVGAFEAEFGLIPDLVFIDFECEGFAGEYTSTGYFLFFGEDDKYNRTIRTEWENLPVEPKASSWTSFG